MSQGSGSDSMLSENPVVGFREPEPGLARSALSRVERRLRASLDTADATDPSTLFRLAKAAVASERERDPELFAEAFSSGEDDGDIAAEAIKRLVGFGPLETLMADDTVEEIWANGPGCIFVSRGGCTQRLDVRLSEPELRRIVERMLGFTGKRLDRSSPFVDAMLADGSRLHAVVPPVTRSWTFNLRKFVGLKASSLGELVSLGSLDEGAAEFLGAAVQAGLNIAVAGAVGSGKTTMLNCLASRIPLGERVVTCEEIFELRIAHPDVVSMQCREPNLEGTGEIPLRRLVKEALRMRPDRIVVGEVRGAEAFDMLLAMNAGCAGMTSVHANTAREALRKLVALPLLAGENISRSFVVSTVASCLDLVVFCRRRRGGGERFVEEVLWVGPQVAHEEVTAEALFLRGPQGLLWTGGFPADTSKFDDAGIDVVNLLKGCEGGP